MITFALIVSIINCAFLLQNIGMLHKQLERSKFVESKAGEIKGLAETIDARAEAVQQGMQNVEKLLCAANAMISDMAD